MACFLHKYIFTEYGLPIEMVTNKDTHFMDVVIQNLEDKFVVIH